MDGWNTFSFPIGFVSAYFQVRFGQFQGGYNWNMIFEASTPMAVPLTSFGFACRVERVDLREKMDAEQTAELVKLFEKPLGYGDC